MELDPRTMEAGPLIGRSRSSEPSGCRRSLPLERMFRDARSRRIGEGTSEIRRMVIARNVLRDCRYLNPLAMGQSAPAGAANVEESVRGR